MEKAKIFMNGRSEAVRLPKSCRFGKSEVCVKRVGHMVLLFPESKTWDVFMHGLNGFSDDFLNTRKNTRPQKRTEL